MTAARTSPHPSTPFSRATGTTIVRTAVQAPRMNAIGGAPYRHLAPGTPRPDLIFGQAHLRAVLPNTRSITTPPAPPGPSTSASRTRTRTLLPASPQQIPERARSAENRSWRPDQRIPASRLKAEKAQVSSRILFSSGTAAPNYAVLLLTRFAAAVPVATFFAVAIATAVSIAPPDKAASTVAKVALGLNLGIILGAPIGTVIGHSIGWAVHLLAVAIASIIALLMVLRLVPARPAAATTSVFGECACSRTAVSSSRSPHRPWATWASSWPTPASPPLLTHVSRFTAGTAP